MVHLSSQLVRLTDVLVQSELFRGAVEGSREHCEPPGLVDSPLNLRQECSLQVVCQKLLR